MIDDEIDDPFALGLRVVMEERGIKPAPLAVAAGLGNSAVRDLFRKGASPKVSTAKALAAQLGLSIDDVIEAGRAGTSPSGPGSSPTDLVPIYNVSASAGYGANIDSEMVVDRLSFPPGYLRKITSSNPQNLAIIGVKGKSMEPTLSDDDIVMVDMTKRDLSYDGLFVIRDDGAGLLVKRISRGPRRGTVLMVSDNPQYPNQEREFSEIEVVGKVIWKGVRE
jgi:phage repressor protein C with HTH and peptisase S24 domain